MIDDVKEELAKAITSSGGLSLVEEEVGIAEDDIDVPQSEFVEETIDEKDDNKVQNIDFEDIRIATPKDKSSPYDNHWIEISSDEELKKLTLTDYDIFAFGYKSDEFNIKDFTYED